LKGAAESHLATRNVRTFGNPRHIGETLGLYARISPDKIGARDLDREMTFRLWYQRSCRLANALTGIGTISFSAQHRFWNNKLQRTASIL
jgi:hypothetical protein